MTAENREGAQAGRRSRLAEALRANLKRRKAQQRQRNADAQIGPASPAAKTEQPTHDAGGGVTKEPG
jgi:hypothetical protein